MPTLASIIAAVCLIGGAALGSHLFPYRADPAAPVASSAKHVAIPVLGKIAALADGALALEMLPSGGRMWIAYDDETLMLARPDRIEDGAVTGSRLIVVGPQELLVAGMTVRATLYGTIPSGMPYAFSLIALPVY